MPFLSHGNPEKLENMAETGKHNLKFVETGKVFLEAAESRKSPKPENQKKSHGKPEKVGIACGKPETDPLFPALILQRCLQAIAHSDFAILSCMLHYQPFPNYLIESYSF